MNIIIPGTTAIMINPSFLQEGGWVYRSYLIIYMRMRGCVYLIIYMRAYMGVYLIECSLTGGHIITVPTSGHWSN